MKKKKIVLAICNLTVLCSCAFLEGTKLYQDLDKYEEYKRKFTLSKEFMPELDTLTNYDNVNLYFWYNDYLGNGSLNLKVSYSEEHYEEEKIKVLNAYQFLTSPIKGNPGEKFDIIPEVKFYYREYYIQVVYNPKFYYCQYFEMIAYSDTLKQICYLYRYTSEPLYIGTFEGGMQEFMKDFFRFEDEHK